MTREIFVDENHYQAFLLLHLLLELCTSPTKREKSSVALTVRAFFCPACAGWTVHSVIFILEQTSCSVNLTLIIVIFPTSVAVYLRCNQTV